MTQTTKPLFSVPEDELTPEYIPLPSAQFDADIANVGTQANENGWKALTLELVNFATPTGETTVTTMHKGREVPLNLATRKKTARYTLAGNPKSVEISLGQLTRLAKGLGIGESVEYEGRATWVITEGDTVEDVAEAFQAAVGQRVRLSIKQQPRKRAGVVQTRDNGEPIIDDEVKSVWHVENGR